MSQAQAPKPVVREAVRPRTDESLPEALVGNREEELGCPVEGAACPEARTGC